MQVDLATTSPKLQIAKGALTATFENSKRHLSILPVAKAAVEAAVEDVVQERMKSNLWNYIQMVFYQLRELRCSI